MFEKNNQSFPNFGVILKWCNFQPNKLTHLECTNRNKIDGI